MSIHEILKKYWGYDQFRELQQDIIESVMMGNDTLALLPTGGGKSICFQVPAMAKEGVCIVVSPLIALMKDQVENLKSRNITAATIHSAMTKREIDITLENAANGQYKFLYVSPERLNTAIFIERAKRMSVNLIAVDEAHCISQWGYDFRPAYLRIIDLRTVLPNIPIIALTATATMDVVEDMQDKLLFVRKNVFTKSFRRDNLSYVVIETEAKQSKLLDILRKVPGTSVVYVRSRKRTKEIALFLQQNGINADFYHAGLDPLVRDQKQAAWTSGSCRAMVCTNAFGMGIDKPDVRTVIHMDIPENIESYYQEAGRAGRDGKKAYAVLLCHQLDRVENQRRLNESLPTLSDIKEMYERLFSFFQIGVGAGAGQTEDFMLDEFCKRTGYAASKAYNILKIFEHEELVSFTDAIYNASKIRILCSSEELYKLQVSFSNYDPLIKTILRTYEGMFDDYSKIKESFLASKLKTNVGEIKKALVILTQHGYIDYIPENASPKLFFIKSRYAANNLLLDVKSIENRRKNKLRQLADILYYSFTKHICRSVILTKYFGESNPSECLVCDVCLQKKKLGLMGEEYEKISNDIIRELGLKKQSIQQLAALMIQYQESKLLETVQWLMECNKIERNDKGQLQITES